MEQVVFFPHKGLEIFKPGVLISGNFNSKCLKNELAPINVYFAMSNETNYVYFHFSNLLCLIGIAHTLLYLRVIKKL